MKRTTIQVLTGPAGFEHRHETPGYQVAGHLHVCHDPRNHAYWVIVHAPTGLRINQGAAGHMPFQTRRRAAAVASRLGESIPELTTQDKIKAFIRRNKAQVRQALSWACLATIGV